MNKYSKKMLNDYISGNEIIGYNIDDLENDCTFIREVIDFSNDKKMYDMCDDNIKGDFEFVKFIINKFKDDKEFCTKVALKFSELSDNNDDIFEVDIIISNLFGYKKDVESVDEIRNCLNARMYYGTCKFEFEMEVIASCDKELEEYYQTGFIYFKELYKDRPIVVDYFAKNMIEDEITKNNSFDFEEYIHKLYKNKEDIQKIGLNNIILNYISLFDSHLYKYAQLHIEVLDNVRNELSNIEKRFDYYNQVKNKQVTEWIVEYLLKYVEESALSLKTSGTGLINFISRDLNIPEIKDESIREIYVNAGVSKEEYDEIEQNEYQSIIDDEEYIILKKYLKRIYESKNIPDDYEEDSYAISKKQIHGKVLIFKKNKK